METIDRWQIGDVRVSRIVDLVVTDFETSIMFGSLSKECVCSVKWLHPNYATETGNLVVSFHAYLIESNGKKILIDTCVGNDKTRMLPFFNNKADPFLERLAQAGYAPEDIDYVLCTHMHADHVGWNTRWDGERWLPTFPNARYLFGRIEWDHWKRESVRNETEEDFENRRIIEDSLAPIIDAGLNDFVEMDHVLTPAVKLMPTPGHTPGHVSVSISSNGQDAIIAGDIMHHPIQLSDPGIISNFDTDDDHALRTRRAFIEAASDKPVLILGTHFARPSGGWIVSDGDGWRFSTSFEADKKAPQLACVEEKAEG